MDQIFLVQNIHIFLSLSKDRTKGQQSKNTSLTPIKTLPTKRITLPLTHLFRLASEHAHMRVFKGSSIFWVRVNLEHLL